MPQNNTNPPNMGYNSQADEFKSLHDDSSIVTPGEAKALHNVPIASSAENAPRKEIKDQDRRKKRLSFGGGNDGRGGPMFKNLESAKGKHMADGYEDQKPPDGFFGAAFKKFVNAKNGTTIAGGK